MPTLKVRARTSASRGRYALVPRYELVDHIASGIVRFPQYVGMKLELDEKTSHGSYKPCGEVEIDDTHENRMHVKHGELWPADEATAKTCGVKFDPAFGGDDFHADKPAAPTDTPPAPAAV